MMDNLGIIVFISIIIAMILTIPYGFIIYYQTLKRLETKHQEQWVALKKPSLFAANNRTSLELFRLFMDNKSYHLLDDHELIRMINKLRFIKRIQIVSFIFGMFISLLMLILNNWEYISFLSIKP